MASDIRFYKRDYAEYGWLSNLYPASFICWGKRWPSVEHAYQAMKSIDGNYRERVRTAPTPVEARRLGQKAVLRPNWQSIKFGIMFTAVRAKFVQNPALCRKLLDTGTIPLIEDSPSTYWGSGTDGRGQNRLGTILMRLREIITMCEHAGCQDTEALWCYPPPASDGTISLVFYCPKHAPLHGYCARCGQPLRTSEGRFCDYCLR